MEAGINGRECAAKSNATCIQPTALIPLAPFLCRKHSTDEWGQRNSAIRHQTNDRNRQQPAAKNSAENPSNTTQL